MDETLQQLGQIPGVVGSVLFSQAGEVESALFPPVFDRAPLDRVALALAGDAHLLDWLKGPTACLDLRFAEGRVVVRPLPQAWLLVLCTPQVNAHLLNLSLTQVVRRLQQGDARPSAPAVAPRVTAVDALRQRLIAVAQSELGSFAPQAVEIFSRANSMGALADAVSDVQKMTRLFVSKKKAEELGKDLRAAFEQGGS